MEHLITPEEFKTLSRPVSVHLDNGDVQAYINECEQLYIIPAIGYGNFKAAVTETAWDSTFDDTFTPDIVINGGEWTADKGNVCAEDDGKTQYCVGLKTALAYYVYAKIARSDGSIYSRAGFMRHEDQYAQHVDDSKLKQYNDIMNIAEQYLGNCLKYLQYHTKDKTIKPIRGSRVHINAIGL